MGSNRRINHSLRFITMKGKPGITSIFQECSTISIPKLLFPSLCNRSTVGFYKTAELFQTFVRDSEFVVADKSPAF